ncbi:hypothetical protein QBC47DRAFT_62761 [Echria macrotheca]|uniref:RGS domain-containing protein n=1 Tax=Echria macrotheca TaxID=438768 RepID=A0AAJ0B983_9PEZI|nr:hypothetical protein QBC47DRAFT_62761 [Echria macrotheca]
MILPRGAVARAITGGSEFGTTVDTKPQVRLDSIGVWWICFGAIWTFFLVLGMVFLYRKRHMPTLRMRGLPLTFAGIVLLHLYWCTVQIGYSVGPLAPEVAEFWIMSIWYPFGIALFQAGNSQFLHIARAQSRFARPDSQLSFRWSEKRSEPKGLFQRIRRMDYSQKMFLFVTLGMTCQLVVVVFIFMISRKFHPDFGIPGTEVYGSTPVEIAIQQGRGWEWWPSLFWQFLWAWVIAPIILWRSRGIRDTHGWQLQTMACCIAGLPAAPMWLIALYVPEMAPVNAVFVPPQWIALSIFVMEIFTVFVPCWQVRKHQNLMQETLDSIASWESKKMKTKSEAASDNSAPPLSPTSTKVAEPLSFDPWKKLPSFDKSEPDGLPTGESVMTMAALEHVLDKNPEPLRKFSATRDFSGENIAFLTAVAEWKTTMPPPFVRNRHNTTPEIVRQQFTRALRIYVDFISPRDAEFPINIAWHELRKLEGIFERAARSTMGDRRDRRAGATPFAEVDWRPAQESRGSEIHMVTRNTPAVPAPAVVSDGNSTDTLALPSDPHVSRPDEEALYFTGDIPAAFDASVFDAAQASIKYLVLTNTWPKYVRERRSSESSAATRSTAETYETSGSKRSLRRALAFLRPMLR